MIRLFRYLRPYRLYIAAALSMILLQSLSELYLPNLMADIVDKGIPGGDVRFIITTGLRMVLVAGLGMVFSVASGYLGARVSTWYGRDLRDMVFSRATEFSLMEFDKLGAPSLITRTTNDINQIQMAVLMTVRMIASAPIMAIGGIVMAISTDARLSMTLVWVLPVLGAVMTFAIVRGAPIFKQIQMKIDRLNLILRENLAGVRVIRAFGREGDETERFDGASRDLIESHLTVGRIMAVMMPLVMLILNFTSIALVWIGGHRIDAGSLEVGGLMAFTQYAMRILFALMNVSFIFIMYPRAAASAERINEVLDMESTIRDPEEPTPEDGAEPGRVEFRNVTFSYPGAEDPVLRDITFTAEPGQVTAIIGGTGSGKSTLVNLIPRFYDVNQGAVLVGGVDVREMSQESLRARIGLVSQKAVLFSGTIGENVRYGKSDASEEEIAWALDVAQSLDFVGELGLKLEASVAQGGTNYSGGQRQRLSIARAVVRRPSIYIFDDSFSALDFRTDARLRAALRQETSTATVLIVAQRVSTVMDAERIVVLEHGRVVGVGNHKELMAQCEVYREIVYSQVSEEEIA